MVRLFPYLAGLRVERVLELDDVICVEVRRTAKEASKNNVSRVVGRYWRDEIALVRRGDGPTLL